MYSATHESVTVASEKYWPGEEPIRLQDSLPCPLKKKKKKKKKGIRFEEDMRDILQAN